jgi:hypothetical protein
MRTQKKGISATTIAGIISMFVIVFVIVFGTIDSQRVDREYVNNRVRDITKYYTPLPADAANCKIYTVGNNQDREYGSILLVTCPNKSVTVSTPSGKNPQSTILVQ